jgi:hypothetical protein
MLMQSQIPVKTGTRSLPPLTAVSVLDQMRWRAPRFHYSLRIGKTRVYRARHLFRPGVFQCNCRALGGEFELTLLGVPLNRA